MSQYEALDRLIVEHINYLTATRDGASALVLGRHTTICRECERIGYETDRWRGRVLYGRLQALRKQGVIRFDRTTGWRNA